MKGKVSVCKFSMYCRLSIAFSDNLSNAWGEIKWQAVKIESLSQSHHLSKISFLHYLCPWKMLWLSSFLEIL